VFAVLGKALTPSSLPPSLTSVTDGTRSFGQQQILGGRQQQPPPQQLGGGALGGLLGGGGGGAGGGAAGGAGGLGGIVPGESGFTADGREYRTIVTPEGYRIILGSSTGGQAGAGGGALGGGGGGAGGGRSGQETKEALLKALIQDLSKNGKQEIIPLQLGARGGSRGGSGGGGELFSGSLDGGSRRRNGGEGGREGEENLTKKTVEAIRQLCVEARLTVLQKQKLIFSVIRSTKQEEVSQVEMAYDLLVENALAGDESALEEFADQCVMLCAAGGAAHSLSYDEDGEDSDDEEFEDE